MAKIEVGMMVEVIGALPKYRHYIGHRGIVLARGPDFWPDHWYVDGIIGDNGNKACTLDIHLRPINPDHKPAEKEWQEDFKLWINDSLTKANGCQSTLKTKSTQD